MQSKNMFRIKARQILIFFILLYLALIMHIRFPSQGGSGLLLPSNQIAWAVMAILVLVVCISRYSSSHLYISQLSYALCAATLLMGIPLLYTPEHWLMSGFTQWLGVAAGLVFYFSILQIKLSVLYQRVVLLGLSAAALIQTIVGIVYLFIILPQPGEWFHYGTEAIGVLAQRNIAATCLNIGLGASLLLWLEPTDTKKLHNQTVFPKVSAILSLGWRVYIPVVMTAVPFMLIFLQSRIGVINAIVIVSGFGLLYWRSYSRRYLRALIWIFTGVTVANLVIWLSPAASLDLLHENSTSYRVQMLSETLNMIFTHPLKGWGLGSFSYEYAHFLIRTGVTSLESVVINHPHNEILFGWAEGGIVMLIAYGILAFAGWKLWQQSVLSDRIHASFHCRGLWLLLLPFLLHSLVEYPFYLSAALWMVFLLLLALCDQASYCRTDEKQINEVNPQEANSFHKIEHADYSISLWLLRLGTLAVGVIAGLTALFMTTALQSGLLLTMFENVQITQPPQEVARINIDKVAQALLNPWVFRERLEFDCQVNNLIKFNTTKKTHLLFDYLEWSSRYLEYGIDPSVYKSRMLILSAIGEQSEVARLSTEVHFLYPKDKRFSP
ncbi:Wzy polymerase domain-containing protein [Hafnia alvei]|uniref:PglL family O-oligosaccharyltransferase n=1 Tax=Hafnia alvei TaxID=569 RepID=UPI00345CB7BC